ncbi:O-antigen ligase family protein [Vibrio sp. ZSDE26]|uniref:O-antigen ligase family protein n=1 Tax=Vibrio amylolyticus TaxID=2847292 RepID=A0A9X1XPS8_9VIBR|nr:O-antigen ligase family protein [Vibrio amylolyticus]MCK6264943.1 O-antigen ligase family protein [Vibrio amylolyticus]
MTDKQRNYSILLILLLCSLITVAWYFVPHPVIPILIAFIPLGALFVLSQTFWLVTLFVLFSFFRIHEALPVLYSLKIPLMLSLGALSALLWHSLVSRQIKIYWHRSFTWLSIFWVLVIVGVFFASSRGIAIAAFTSVYWKIIVMTLAIAWLVNNNKNIGRIAIMITLSGALIACVALYNSANGIDLVEGTRVSIGRKFGSMLGDPNDLSLVLMFPLAFAIGLVTTPKTPFIKRLIGLITTCLLMSAIIATQSRGGLLGSVSVIGIYAIKIIRSKVLLLTLGAIGAVILYFVAGISDRASGGAHEEGIDESAMGRIYAWEAAFKMALHNPLTGVGIDNFFANYFFYSSHWDGLNHAVHSTWFGVLAETGFLGLIIFLCFITSLILSARHTLAAIAKHPEIYSPNLVVAANAVYAGLIGTIVSGTFLTQGFNWPIYILAALTVAVANIAEQCGPKSDENSEETDVQSHSQIENQ